MNLLIILRTFLTSINPIHLYMKLVFVSTSLHLFIKVPCQPHLNVKSELPIHWKHPLCYGLVMVSQLQHSWFYEQHSTLTLLNLTSGTDQLFVTHMLQSMNYSSPLVYCSEENVINCSLIELLLPSFFNFEECRRFDSVFCFKMQGQDHK